MPIWLITNWRYIALAAALAWGGAGWWEYTDLKATRAEERAAALEVAQKAVEDAREKDAKNAQLARDLDATRAKADADIAAGRDEFERRLANVLRQRRKASCDRVPGSTDSTGAAAAIATGSDGGRGQIDPGPANRVRDVIKALQADVKECVAWGKGVGR